MELDWAFWWIFSFTLRVWHKEHKDGLETLLKFINIFFPLIPVWCVDFLFVRFQIFIIYNFKTFFLFQTFFNFIFFQFQTFFFLHFQYFFSVSSLFSISNLCFSNYVYGSNIIFQLQSFIFSFNTFFRLECFLTFKIISQLQTL